MNYLNLFKKIETNRVFEQYCAKAFDKGEIKSPIYLSLGQEHIPAIISEIYQDWLIFAQHRAHSYFLSFGGDPKDLIQQIKGKRGSASISRQNMFGHSGLLGDQVPIAVGAAEVSQKPVLCVLGDAAAEEDYVLGALGYAGSRKCPILFICEDNNLSILTEKKVRRKWNIHEVARKFGIPSSNLYIDNLDYVIEEIDGLIYNVTKQNVPMLLNIEVERECWHCGSGKDPRKNTGQTMYEILLDHVVKEYGFSTISLVKDNIEYRVKEWWNVI